MEWQKKLFNHEENPPGDVWSRISAKLDEELWIVRKNLGNFEATPPAPIWEELSAKLEAENFTRRKSLGKLVSLTPVRIAAAAAVAGAIILAAYYFINNSQIIRPSDIAANMIDSQKSSSSRVEKSAAGISKTGSDKKDTQRVIQKGEIENHEQQPNKIDITESAENIEERKYSPVQLSKLNIKTRPDELARKLRMRKIGNGKNEIGIPNPQYFSPSYMTVTDENGVTYKVSIKLRDIIHYLQGADTQIPNQNDQFVSENNYWQSVFREWKKKLSSGTFIPDSGNFLDIMDLMQLIQQNK